MSSSSNSLPVPPGQEKKETWTGWGGRKYNEQYENWMPWVEDQYLKWFGKDNKASYATKGKLRSVPIFTVLHTMTDTEKMHSQKPK
jgi:hypothetical protein